MTERIRFHESRFAGLDAMTAATGRSFPRHTHDQFGIGIVDSGGHASWSGRGQVEAGPGKFICVNPGEVHDGHAIGGGTRSWRILYFEPDALDQLRFDVLEGANSPYVFKAPVFDDPILQAVFNCAFAHATAQLPGDMACETAILHLVARLETHSSSGKPRAPCKMPCIRRARERIDTDPAAPLTLAELANEAGLSRYQLLRSFARELGLTPHAYILQQRLALSRRLIRAGLPLTEAALRAGFCDQSHLHRCFLRQFGVTPRSYALGR